MYPGSRSPYQSFGWVPRHPTVKKTRSSTSIRLAPSLFLKCVMTIMNHPRWKDRKKYLPTSSLLSIIGRASHYRKADLDANRHQHMHNDVTRTTLTSKTANRQRRHADIENRSSTSTCARLHRSTHVKIYHRTPTSTNENRLRQKDAFTHEYNACIIDVIIIIPEIHSKRLLSSPSLPTSLIRNRLYHRLLSGADTDSLVNRRRRG